MDLKKSRIRSRNRMGSSSRTRRRNGIKRRIRIITV
jgi:hypothetical protein